MFDLEEKRKAAPPSKGLRHYVPARELEVRAVDDKQDDGTGPVTLAGSHCM